MKAHHLIASLKKTLGTTSQFELAETLGVTVQTLHNWKNQKKNLTPRQVAHALAKARNAAILHSQHNTIKPIVEHFKIRCIKSSKSSNFEIFSAEDSVYLRGLRQELKLRTGIYIYYDSGGRALYVGKAQRQKLWREMNHVFNRPRVTQTLFRVAHPNRNQQFKPQYEQARQPRRQYLKLHELAEYFSAYAVDDGMIEDLEALIVRGLANDLLNIRMERFAHARKVG